ncbi:MAG: SpoIIE family protein phosphatase [Phycisphaerae bacterium]|nr:SpoIIE family protein phosphatase [Phycisphaerae bacterium]
MRPDDQVHPGVCRGPVVGPVVAVVALGVAPSDAECWCRRLTGVWPAAPAPCFVGVDPGATPPGDAAALLVLAGPSAAADAIARVRHILDDSLIPGLMLRDGPPAGGTLTALPLASDPRTVAGALSALLARQPALEQLRRDLAGEGLMRAAAARQIDQMQNEANMAVLVQRELLPRSLPEIDGLDLGVLFRPGTDLSGDLYDAERLDEHHIGFLVADAAGHGAPAALMTMLISRLLPTKEVSGRDYRIVPPAEALTRLNDAFLSRRGDLMAIVSAVYGVIDARSGQVLLANAGHPHPLIVGPDGSRALAEGGPLLGMAEGICYEQHAFTLGPRETLVLYSDGFEHAFRDAGPASTAGNTLYLGAFSALGRRRVGQPLAEAIAAMSGDLDGQRGSLHQVDDITMLALARRATAAGARAAA